MKKSRKIVYCEKYKKNSIQDKSVRPFMLEKIKASENVYLVEGGLYNDGNGFLTIRFDFINEKAN